MWGDLKSYIARGQRALATSITDAKNRQTDLSEEELRELLVGFARNRNSTVQHKDQRPLTYSDLITFDMNLAGTDPVDSLQELASKGRFRDVRGLLKGFIATLYWTGIRPTEVWKMRLLVPRPDAWIGPEVRQMIRETPAKAIGQGHLMPVEDASKETGDGLEDTLRNCLGSSQAPAVLVVFSAKQTNVKTDLKAPFRLFVLEGMEAHWLRLIAVMAQSRYLDLDDYAKSNLHRKMNYLLPVIVAHDSRYNQLQLSLYSFRHGFATRAKKALPPWEAAALTGHSSKRTLYAYGERNARGKGGRSLAPEDWLPLPDLERAEQLRVAWGVGDDLAMSAAPVQSASRTSQNRVV